MSHEETKTADHVEERAEKCQMHVWFVNLTPFDLVGNEYHLEWGKLMEGPNHIKPYTKHMIGFKSQGRANTATGTTGWANWILSDKSILTVRFSVPWSGKNTGKAELEGHAQDLVTLEWDGPNPSGDVATMTIVLSQKGKSGT